MPPKAAKAAHVLEAPALPAEGFCRLPQILSVLATSRTTFLTGVKAGKFPKPLHIGRSAVWKVSDIRQLIADIEAGKLQ